jgi:hypothetical protein
MSSLSTLVFLLAVISASQEPSIDGDSGLLEFLSGSLATNRALAEEGHGVFRVDCQFERTSKRLIIEAEATWIGDKFAQKMRYYDPNGIISGRKFPNIAIDSTPWDRILVTQDRVYWYIPEQDLVRVSMYQPNAKSHWFFYILPQDHWYHCCPPRPADGPLWSDFLQLKSTATRFVKSVEVSQAGGRIAYKRTDKDGGTLTVTADPGYCTNITAYEYKARDGAVRKGNLTWEAGTEPCTLRSMEYTSSLPDGTLDERYLLTVVSCKFGKVNDRASLSPSGFLRSLPPNTIIEDLPANRTYRLNVAGNAPSRPATWDDLVQELRGRGFLKGHEK